MAPTPGYAGLRQRIMAAPPGVADSLDSLAGFLADLTTDQRGRAYAIFFWLAQNIAYDTHGLFSGDFGDLTPAGVLQRREAVCAGYSRLFHALAGLMGLNSVEISGLAKGYSYASAGTLGAHAWNAVELDGHWQLIDATWGAGHLDEQGRFQRELDEFYFLTPPAQFIYSHFPDDRAWQLVSTELSRAEFEHLPDLEPAFFIRGLTLAGAPVLSGGRWSLELATTQDVVGSVHLESGGQRLPDRFGSVTRQGDRLRVSAVFPRAGRYTVQIYVAPAADSATLDRVGEFVVEASAGEGERAGFPRATTVLQAQGGALALPLTYYLSAGQAQPFDLRLPNATDVAVVDASEQWHHLTKSGDRFQGTVTTAAGALRVFAAFNSSAVDFQAIATYQVE
jgi:hypothetical protein